MICLVLAICKSESAIICISHLELKLYPVHFFLQLLTFSCFDLDVCEILCRHIITFAGELCLMRLLGHSVYDVHTCTTVTLLVFRFANPNL